MDLDATADGGGSEGRTVGWDKLVMGGWTFAGTGKFSIELVSSAAVPSFDSAQSYSWLIAHSGYSSFNAANLDVDASGFTSWNPSAGTGTFSLSTLGGGSDLYVDYTAAPEPTSLLLTGGLAVAVALLRRPRRNAPAVVGSKAA